MTHKESMYKITLYDANCSPVSDGVALFFTNDLDEFEKNWLATGRVDNDTYERFIRSRSGEVVTDYYVDSPELNIVQRDEACIYGERSISIQDREFTVTNTYGCASKYYVANLDILFRWIGFKNQYFRIASFTAKGVCWFDDLFTHRWKHAGLYGNPVLHYLHYLNELEPGYEGSCVQSDFADNQLSSFCFLVNGEFANEHELTQNYENFKMDERVLDRLFSDVIGEAG